MDKNETMNWTFPILKWRLSVSCGLNALSSLCFASALVAELFIFVSFDFPLSA